MSTFDRFDIATYAGKRFAFRDHGSASFFGMGPWVLAEGETGRSFPDHGGSCAVRFVCADGGFSYSPFVTVWPEDVLDTFEVSA